MYNRLFTKILDSSVWLEPIATRIVWVTLIAAMDQDGVAHFSAVENLANRARVSIDEAETAIKCFLSPDSNSGDPEHEGRRVERIPGGFLILNAGKYREIFSREIQREQTRIRVAKHREKKRVVTVCNDLKQTVTQSEADADADAEAKTDTEKKVRRFAPPSQAEASVYCAKVGVSEALLAKWFAFYETNGWKVGKNPMKSWQASIRYWKTNESQYSNGHGKNSRSTAAELRNAGTEGGNTDYGELAIRYGEKPKR